MPKYSLEIKKILDEGGQIFLRPGFYVICKLNLWERFKCMFRRRTRFIYVTDIPYKDGTMVIKKYKGIITCQNTVPNAKVKYCHI